MLTGNPDAAWPPGRSRAVLASLLVAHAALVLWISYRTSPNPDEMAHLAAGLFVWREGRFDLYCVNPPLPRLLAALPVLCHRPRVDWSRYDGDPVSREEFSIGSAFCQINGRGSFWYFTTARWACIPLSLIGGCVCWRWANKLYGQPAGALGATLWCFSPNVTAWSATICPDAAAAALGLAASYFFWRWLQRPDWRGAGMSGVGLGLANLAKTTWLILFAIWPILWLHGRWMGARDASRRATSSGAAQLAAMLGIGLVVINQGYAFDGTFSRLGDFRFVSRALGGNLATLQPRLGGNRFAGAWTGSIRIPFPKAYVQGIDLQKRDFERGLPSYLLGRWSGRGWWYYYLVCAALKVPLGTWGLALLAMANRLSRIPFVTARQCGREARPAELPLLLPAAAVFVLVSSHSGFSRHFRYVLPAFPFFFVWASQTACLALRRPRGAGIAVAIALAWSVSSSLWVYPHSMSYFNELAGGPIGGPRYLLDSNVDWGQDVLYLKEWCEKHPEATPLQVFWRIDPGLESLNDMGDDRPLSEKTGFRKLMETSAADTTGLRPGWYAASVHELHNPGNVCHQLLRFQPVARVGYSIRVYQVREGEAVEP